MQNARTERLTRTSKPVTAQPHSYFNLRGGFTRESLKRSTLRNNSQVASLQYSWAGLMPVAKHPPSSYNWKAQEEHVTTPISMHKVLSYDGVLCTVNS